MRYIPAHMHKNSLSMPCGIDDDQPACCEEGERLARGDSMVQALRVKRTEKKEVTPLVWPAGKEYDRSGQTPELSLHDDGKLSLWWPDGTVELWVPAAESDWKAVEAPRVELQ
jgi:hypothetical protein